MEYDWTQQGFAIHNKILRGGSLVVNWVLWYMNWNSIVNSLNPDYTKKIDNKQTKCKSPIDYKWL